AGAVPGFGRGCSGLLGRFRPGGVRFKDLGGGLPDLGRELLERLRGRRLPGGWGLIGGLGCRGGLLVVLLGHLGAALGERLQAPVPVLLVRVDSLALRGGAARIGAPGLAGGGVVALGSILSLLAESATDQTLLALPLSP